MSLLFIIRFHMSSLDRLVRRIHDECCCFRLPDDKVKDIEDMVVSLVKFKLPVMLQRHSRCRYSIAEVVNAGSYFEQTKIELPNEFDFMLVVEQLSREDSIFISQGCKPGHARVAVQEPELWDTARSEDSPEHQFEIALLQFNVHVRETLKLLLSEPLKGRSGQLQMKGVTVRGKPFKAFSHVQTLTLKWTEITVREPNTTVLYKRRPSQQEEIEVCVDLMACCHLPLPAFIGILPDKCFQTEGLIKNGCHIVLKSCESFSCMDSQRNCRLISYTKTEQECMKRLHVTWKVAYRTLKWLFRYTEVLEVDTYKIKTAVLYCSSRQHGSGNLAVGEALIQILQVLRDSAHSNKLPGYFNESQNVWTVSPSYQYLVKYEMIFLLKLFNNIRRDPNGQSTDVSRNLEIVHLWIHSFCSHAAEISRMNDGRLSPMERFNGQGNKFLDIMRDMEPTLKTHSALAWIPFQMKCYVLFDVFKVLFPLFVQKTLLFSSLVLQSL